MQFISKLNKHAPYLPVNLTVTIRHIYNSVCELYFVSSGLILLSKTDLLCIIAMV